MFSGYHAPTGLVHAVLRAVGVRQEDLAAETAAIGVRRWHDSVLGCQGWIGQLCACLIANCIGVTSTVKPVASCVFYSIAS